MACLILATSLYGWGSLAAQEDQESLTPAELQLIRNVENERIKVIEKVVGSVIAVYGPSRQGGGSGVIIDPSGIALTNHHVIEGAGMKGFGGLDDGELYEWDLIGTDPGGDVAIIKMKGMDRFPYSRMGDSDKVKVGDWALAMGNPFLLAHDQVPTVTLGVVSGVERFQEGMGAQLVYGNCIQIDSSINPGNSGGPLFNMDGEVIGINGRGSFRDRGRVNVGLGYAISSNQIKNFLPDLLATKIVEHGTLDAAFSNRDGKVLCSTIDLDSPAARAGLELGDELLEFEGRAISYANQFKNLICTYPEDWPALLKVRKKDGSELTINVRMFGLPYNFPADEEQPSEDGDPEDKGDGSDDDKSEKDQPEDPKAEPEGESKEGESKEGESKEGESKEGESKEGDAKEGESKEGDAKEKKPTDRIPGRRGRKRDGADLKKYLQSEPGVVTNYEINAASVEYVFGKWKSFSGVPATQTLVIKDELQHQGKVVGQQKITLSSDGRFVVAHQLDDSEKTTYSYDGKKFWMTKNDEARELEMIEAKINPIVTQALAITAGVQKQPFQVFGKPVLDGGDKSQARVASRIMWLDDDDDWFFGWLALYNEQGDEQVRLLKVSSDKDCSGTSQGMTFGDYRENAGVVLPHQKSLVQGLNEEVLWTAVTQSVDVVDDQTSIQYGPVTEGGE